MNDDADVDINSGTTVTRVAAGTTTATPPVPSGYVRLVSGDGFSFMVDEEYACASSVINAMLHSSFREAHTREVQLPEVSGRVLAKVCEYLYYVRRFEHAHRQNSNHNNNNISSSPPSSSPSPSPSPSPSASQLVNSSSSSGLTDSRGNNFSNDESVVETFPIPSELSVDVFNCAKYLDL